MCHTVGTLVCWLAVAYIACIVTPCESALTRSSSVPDAFASNNGKLDTANRGNDADDEDDDDDFVPYQGERIATFDWSLLKAISKRYSGNVLLSPISLKLVLVLLYEGAQDETAHELAAAMQLPATRTAVRDRFSNILHSLQAVSPSYTFNFGTRLYVDANISVRQRYSAVVKSFYNTDVINANLSDAEPIVREINSWVSNVTDANIDRMIEDDKAVQNSLMLIVNGLFFQGSWRRKYFAAENTRTDKFYTNKKHTVDVPFMTAYSRFYYSESAELDAKILRIPYSGHKFAMYLLLPRTLDGIEHLVRKVNPFLLTRHVWLMQDLPINVTIPKFKFDFSSHLEPALRELGIRDIFDDTATLTGIARSKRASKHLKVSDIIQKAGIEVNENGTTAYVATEIDIGNKIEDQTFHANRPFLFYIEDESMGTIIYMGKIMNPLETSNNAESPNRPAPSKFGPPVPDADLILQAGLNSEDRSNLFNLYFSQAVSKECSAGNLASSPASIKLALTMLMEAANGDTKSEIVSSLRLPDNESRRNEITEHILASLKRSKNGTEIDATTRLWVDQSLNVLKSYNDTLRSRYHGDIRSVNFVDSQSTATLINDWIRRATRNAISTVPSLNDIQPDTKLMLTSAIYFKGRWMKAFDKANTKLRCFYMPDGNCRNTYFMKHESIYRYVYISSIEAHVLEIPYSDGRSSMLTLMPSSREKDPHLRILSEDLANVPVSAILANLKSRDLTVYIPKFSIESSLNLVPTLERLSIKSIFQPDTNLTKMISSGSVRVTSIFQNVKIEIDEEGALAAGNTGIFDYARYHLTKAESRFLLLPNEDDIITDIGYEFLSSFDNDVKLDRPFLFMIVDFETSTTLFSGRFVEPL